MSNSFFYFKILHQSTKSSARVGIINTPHGPILTPGFVPVATNASMKSFDSFTLESLDIDLLFCNTYHLSLHPGADIVENAGGLHSFMRRNKPIITDSGGFQIFSLAYTSVHDELKSKGKKSSNNSIESIKEKGVIFRSYRDGQKIEFTPEISVQIQKKLGADIIIPLDELLPFHSEETYLKKSFYRTHRWQERSFGEHLKNINNQAIYAVVHGNLDEKLRKESCKILSNSNFNGYAIGGSLGKNTNDILSVLSWTIPCLDPLKPKHLLGIGDIPSLIESCKMGIDTLDSAYPTKCARHGLLFHKDGNIKIEQGKWKNYHHPISNAPLVKEYSAAYIHHLFKTHEQLAGTLASIHNIYFMAEYMKEIREKILENKI